MQTAKVCISCSSADILPAVFVGNGQFLAAVTTAGSQHAAAVRGSHSLTETVLVDAFAAGGLECSFHDIYLLYFFCFSKRTAKVKFFLQSRKFFFFYSLLPFRTLFFTGHPQKQSFLRIDPHFCPTCPQKRAFSRIERHFCTTYPQKRPFPRICLTGERP